MARRTARRKIKSGSFSSFDVTAARREEWGRGDSAAGEERPSVRAFRGWPLHGDAGTKSERRVAETAGTTTATTERRRRVGAPPANGSGGYDRIFFLKRASDEEALYLAARLV